LAEGLNDRVKGRAPFHLHPGICLTTEENMENLGVVAQFWVQHVASTWPFCSGGLDWPAVHLSYLVDRDGLQTVLGRRRCLPSCRINGFPASDNFESKLSINALMWSAKKGIPKSS
jgi:hypothetical protein